MNPLRRFWRAVLDDGAPPTRQQQAEAFRRAARKRATMQRVTVLGAVAERTGVLGPHINYPTTTVVTVALFDGTRRTLNVHDWESVADRFPAGMPCSMRIPTRSRPLTDELIPPFAGPVATPWPPHASPGDDDFLAELAYRPGEDGTGLSGPLVLYCSAVAAPIAVDDQVAGAIDGMSPTGWAGLVRIDPGTGQPTRVGLYRKPWLDT